MPKEYNVDQIRLLATQRMLTQRLKKGDFIPVGKDSLLQLEQILRDANIDFSTLPYAYDIYLITIY